MKKTAILLSILVVVLFAAPGLIGFMAQNQYQEIIIGMQQAGIEVTRRDYRRGWFGSQAETEFKLALPRDLGVDGFTLSMHSDIVHGPLSPEGGMALASIGTYFMINGKPLFPDEENKVLNTKIGLGGSGKTLIDFPALKLAGKPGEPEIQFSGADGELLFDTSFTQLDIDLNVPAFWMGGGEGQSLKITGVTIGSESRSAHSSLRLGNGKLAVKRIDFVNPKRGVSLAIDAIELFGDTKAEGDNITFTGNYSLNAITVNEINYGPAQIELDLGNIHAAAATKLKNEIQQLRRENLNQQEQRMAMTNLLVEVGQDLLKANPKLDVKRFYVKTPDGDVDGDLTLATDGLLLSDIGNIQAILNKLNADASIRVPEKLLRSMLGRQANQSFRQHFKMRKQMDEELAMPTELEIHDLVQDLVQQQLGNLLRQNMLIRDGAYISSSAKLGRGLLSVNGKTIPLNLVR